MAYPNPQQLADMQQLIESSESEKYVLVKEDAYVFEDGTAASLWQPPYENSHVQSYRLSEEQELLDVFLPVSIDGTTTEGLKGTELMSPEALEAAQAYYEEMGSLLDIPALLENAYEDYKQCQETGKNFEMHFVSQDSSPCVETERFVGFLTSWDTPASGKNGEYHEMYQAALFDRTTGDIIPVTDLFTVSEEEAIEILLQFCVDSTTKSKEEVRPLITSERVQWMQDGIELYFYAGELHNDESEYFVEISYDEIQEYLHDWAIPDNIPE